MIVSHEIVALTAGTSPLGFAWFLKQLIRKEPIESEGWAGFFGVTGSSSPARSGPRSPAPRPSVR